MHTEQQALFETTYPSGGINCEQTGDVNLSQYFTPQWAAEALVEQFFPSLKSADLVLEPSCGQGAFLQAIPADIPAIGVEVDPQLAREAARNTGRRVITGDFRSVDLPSGITAIVGNPPFSLDVIEGFLARAATILPMEGECGLILPAYTFQTANTVDRIRAQWSIRCEMLPRTLFAGLSKPLVFAMFTRSASRKLFGFCLYDQAVEIEQLSKDAKTLLTKVTPRRSAWRALVEDVLRKFGGNASLHEIYSAVSPRRPTNNPFWREQIRKVLQLHFYRFPDGSWGVPSVNDFAAAV